jgi:pimeloyl-ACP methyl ester carboxylesterase
MIEKKYHTGLVELNYGEAKASGLPMLLIHGSGSIWQDWQPVIEAFATKNHLFAVDLRGFGGSGRVSGSYDITTFADDVADFIKGVVPSRPVVVGHSLGALITIDLACRYPELVEAVVLEDPPVSMLEDIAQWDGWSYFEIALEVIRDNIPTQEAICRFTDGAGYSLAEAERATRNIKVIDSEIFELALKGQIVRLKSDIYTALSLIQCRCLFISSDFKLGSLVKPNDLPEVKKSLKKGTMALFKKVGHGIHMESTQAFNQLLNEFLANLK